MKKVIFSGIQPSGKVHIGNYIGAIKYWLELQQGLYDELITNRDGKETKEIGINYDLFFCIVDLHAITVDQDPEELRRKTLEVAALYLACGIKPDRARLFIQSQNPDHTYLAWIFDCLLDLGELFRMTQFKDKVEKSRMKRNTADAVRDLFAGRVGLFNYPALMAADILLYDTDLVPVGEDQRQHIELTRDLGNRFNRKFAKIFKIPSWFNIKEERARIMSLQEPSNKMSKSDSDPKGTINLLDSREEIARKIKIATTDSKEKISLDYMDDRLNGIPNMLNIYGVFSETTYQEALRKFDGVKYSSFKQELTELLIEKLEKIQKDYKKWIENKDELIKILDRGVKEAKIISSKKVIEVKKVMGLG